MNDARGHIYMKRVFLALCTVVLVLMACSNDDSSDSIITDKDVMYISNSGGTDTWFKVMIPHDNTSLIVATITDNALASSDRWCIKINVSAGGESDKYIFIKSKEHDK